MNAAYRKDVSYMWILAAGKLIDVPFFLNMGGPWHTLAAFDGVCGVLTTIALAWESYVS